jgi:capsid protein
VDWSTPKWDYVNPEQDVKADLAEISGGLTTISEKLRKRGYKPDLVFQELKADFDRLRADGTLDVMLQLQTNQAPQAEKSAAPAIK